MFENTKIAEKTCPIIQKNRHIDLNDVQSKIRNEVYKELINDLRNKGNVTIAITPIFTMGTAEFDKFERDENGKVKLVDISQNQNQNKFIPEKPVYHFTNEAYSPNSSLPQCKPVYCEQPLIYILEYTMELCKRIKDKQNKTFFSWLGNLLRQKFLSFASSEDFLSERDALRNKMVKEKDGYCFISNPLKL